MHRLRLLLRSATPLPSSVRSPLVGVLHAWLGDGNRFHDAASAYALGRLQPAPADAPDGVTHTWTLGVADAAMADALVAGLAARPFLFPDVPVVGLEEEAPPAPWPRRTFWRTDSPLLLRRSTQGRKVHLAWNHPDALPCLADALRRRLALVGCPADAEPWAVGLHPPGRTETEDLHGRPVTVSHVGLWLDAPPEVQRTVWACGAGQNTGAGFGLLTLAG